VRSDRGEPNQGTTAQIEPGISSRAAKERLSAAWEKNTMRNQSDTRERSAQTKDRHQSENSNVTEMRNHPESLEQHSSGKSGGMDEKMRNRSSGKHTGTSDRDTSMGGAPSRQTSTASDEKGQL
jgi:hypothetical protein